MRPRGVQKHTLERMKQRTVCCFMPAALHALAGARP